MQTQQQDTISFFDLESTGTSITKDRIVSISCKKTDLQFNAIPGSEKNFILNPEIPIPQEASDVHGITNEMVIGKPTFKQIAKGVLHYFLSSRYIGGYNIKKFDIPLLCEELYRVSKELGDMFVFHAQCCGIVDGLIVFREKEKRDLKAALKFYCDLDEVEGGAHNAENDNNATIQIVEAQSFYYDDLNTVDAIAKLAKKTNKDGSFELDFDGKILVDVDGIPRYGFGKDIGKSIIEEPGFAKWMLGDDKDFSTNTKNVIRNILYPKTN